MVPLIIVYLPSGTQLLLRGKGGGEHVFGPREGLRAPFFWASPPTSSSVLEGSSTASARRSAPRAGPRGRASHQPLRSDASLLPQRFDGTCQWWRIWLLGCTQTPALPADKLRRRGQGLAVSLALLRKESLGYPLLVMRALPTRPTSELRKPVHLRDVGGSRPAPRVIVLRRPPLAHHLCSRWGQGVQVGDASAPPALPGAAHLSRGPAALPPAVAPVHAPAVRDWSVALATHPTWVTGDGTRTGPRPGGRQRWSAEGGAVFARLVVLRRGEPP
jgi:hypothetical protein